MMTRRGFLATVLALPFASKLKPKPQGVYYDTESLYPYPMMVLQTKADKNVVFVRKIYMSSLYGKFASYS
jgi:hypothetical protein